VEISHLRYFFFVAQTGSFRRGAELAHVSAPAMTKAIQKLEDETGARLFERTTRRVVLTEEGKVVFARAREVLGQVEAIRRDLDALQTSIAGELRIGAMEVFSLYALPRAISTLVTEFHELVPLAYEMHPESIERHLAGGLLDVGFTIGAASSKEIHVEVLGTSKGRIVCGRGHPLYRGKRVTKADLARHPFVVPRFFQREYLPSLDQFPDDVHPRRVGATIELLQMAVELTLSGRFLGYFPEVTIEHHLASGDLRVLDGLDRLPTFDLQALTRKGAAPKRSAALLIAEIKSKLRSSGRRPGRNA
jgi:LysR family cyn operon transcriptional activator